MLVIWGITNIILQPETSLLYEEAPILLQPDSDKNAIITIFGNSENAGGKIVGFGAEQVILVHDDSAKKEISAYVGNHALVLTIVECKGLEFQVFIRFLPMWSVYIFSQHRIWGNSIIFSFFEFTEFVAESFF